MAYAYTILYVTDVVQSMAFYQAALGFEPRFITPESDYGELDTAGTTLAFAHVDLANSHLSRGFQLSSDQLMPFGIELGFVVEDVAKSIAQVLAAGGRLYEAPVNKPWGQEVAYVLDNNGFLIELCTAVNHG